MQDVYQQLRTSFIFISRFVKGIHKFTTLMFYNFLEQMFYYYQVLLRDMVKHELRVTSWELRVMSYNLKASKHELEASKHELKFKSASSNPQVTRSNPRFTSLNPQVTSSNSWVTSSNPRITKSIKSQVNSLIKSSSFRKILSPK